LTYVVHAASTVLARSKRVVASEFPRRNRCFHSSILKVRRSRRPRRAVTSTGYVCGACHNDREDDHGGLPARVRILYQPP
jgi:hypothetical protein